MSIAEKKLSLVKMLLDCNDDTTDKLFQLMQQDSKQVENFSDEEIRIFEKARNDFFASGEKGYTVEEAHNWIRQEEEK